MSPDMSSLVLEVVDEVWEKTTRLCRLCKGVWSLSFGTESGVSLGEEVVIVCLSSFFSLCSDFSPLPFKGEIFFSSLVGIGASSSSLSSSPLSLSLLVLVLLVLVYVSSEEKERVR